MGMEFNVQTFLSEMRAELRSDHMRLVERVDQGFTEMSGTVRAVRDELIDHTAADFRASEDLDKRLRPIEEVIQKSDDTIKWTKRTVIGAVIVGGMDLLFHWKLHL